ncbi:MAG: restriction endonuclease subunit S [Acidobacteria bacterium]|nr:restriction endonuclease subunit S [Acidobacteriota bacterium]
MTLTIPVGSEARRLRFLFGTTSGATPSSGVEEYWDGDIYWVTPEDLGKLSDRYVRETRRRITELGYKNCGVSLAGAGSIVLSKRAPIGQTAILGVPSTCNQGCFLLSKLDDVDERFYYYALIHLRPALEALGRGSTFMELSADDLRSVLMPFPREDNQRLIANYLDRETARIDGLIAEKERMLALLEEKRAAVISRVVTRGLDTNTPLKPSGQEWLGEIPAHWNICQLKRTWASSDYGLSESIRDEGEIAVLRMSCIVDGRIDVSKSGMIAEVDDNLLLRRNDLLFNRTNSLDQIAKVGLVDFDPVEPLTFASYLVRIRADHRATPQYLVALLNSSLFLEFARKNAIPAIGQANLSPTRYGEIHIPLPPKAEQDEIVTFLDRDAAALTPVREYISSSVGLLKERRAALISAAVTGQIPLEEMTE